MSIEVYKRAWGATVKGSDKLMLLALAEHANDDGVCWPAYKRLADMVGTSERHAKRIIDNLENAGCIRKWENRGRGHSNLYFIKVGLSDQETQEIETYIEQLIREKGDTHVTFKRKQKVTPMSPINEEKVTSRAVKGDTHVTRTVKEPSIKDNTNNIAAKKKPKSKKPHPLKQDIQRAMVRMCHKNWAVMSAKEKGQLGNVADKLAPIIEQSPKLPDVTTFETKFITWWEHHDWRGQKQQDPTPYNIQETFGSFEHWLEIGAPNGKDSTVKNTTRSGVDATGRQNSQADRGGGNAEGVSAAFAAIRERSRHRAK